MNKLKTYLILEIKIVLFLLLPLVAFTLFTSKSDALGISSFVVLTGSMEPATPVGSVIYTWTQPSYQKGDVIAFKQGNNTVTHRIVEVQKKSVSSLVSPLSAFNSNHEVQYRTKGDANNVVDSNLVAHKEVIGKGIFSLTELGNLILFLKTKEGFFSLIILPIFIFIGFELWGIRKEIIKETEKKFLEKYRAV